MYVSVEDLNSGLHAFMASTLPARPSSQPSGPCVLFYSGFFCVSTTVVLWLLWLSLKLGVVIPPASFILLRSSLHPAEKGRRASRIGSALWGLLCLRRDFRIGDNCSSIASSWVACVLPLK